MTTMDEFLTDCIETGDAKRIEGVTRQREADRFFNLADYHRTGVQDHLDGEARLLAIRQGYYAMLHTANAALALAGFKVSSHPCTIKGLSAVFDASDLADDLRRAGAERINVDYNIDPQNPTLDEFEDASEFVEDTMEPFLDRIDTLLDEEGLR